MKTAIAASSLLLIFQISSGYAAPYIGLDGNLSSFALNESDPYLYPQSASGFDLRLGDRFGKVGGEISYGDLTQSPNANQDGIHLDQLSGDGFVYLPFYGTLDFLVTAGGSQTNYGISSYLKNTYTAADGKTKTTNADITLLHGDEFDWRAGLGLSAAVFDRFELRAIARYQPLSMQGNAKNAITLSFGVSSDF